MESHRAHIAMQLLDSLQLQAGLDSPHAMSRAPSFISVAAAGANQIAGSGSGRAVELVGELLMQSHAGYTSCGIGSVGTDTLVRLARECMQADASGGLSRVYGARITGGGAGGCVCIATTSGKEGEEAVQSIAKKYRTETHHTPTVIGGSSTGASWFDHALVRIKKS